MIARIKASITRQIRLTASAAMTDVVLVIYTGRTASKARGHHSGKLVGVRGEARKTPIHPGPVKVKATTPTTQVGLVARAMKRTAIMNIRTSADEPSPSQQR